MSNSIAQTLRNWEVQASKTNLYRAASDFTHDASRKVSQCQKAVVKAYNSVTNMDSAVENCGKRANLKQNDRASKNQYGEHGSCSTGRAMLHTYKDSYESTPVNTQSSDADRWKAAQANARRR